MAEANIESNGITDVEMTDAIQDDNALDTDEEGGFRVDDDVYIPPPLYRIGKVDTSGPRLMITKIVCENFKSYAGTQVIGPFHQCFSAIVGPNGSGKSNVIDSMLFVFGYRASKIRSKKISVLIHNSSEHPNTTKCTVSVHFQRIVDKPGATYDVVPNSEFVISRTASKDNSSYYELNDRKVQFKEIAKLLRSYCVDLDHNRFLILQGEVEQIAMMKPKGQNENDIGMLEFLEDIIGTVRYKEPLEKLSEKVELLTERREEKLVRLRVVEQEKAALQEPMQEAVQYLRMENAVTRIENEFYQCKRTALARETTELGTKVSELEKDLSNLNNELKTVEQKKEEINSTMKEKSSKWNALQTEKEDSTTKFDEIRKRDEALHAELIETNKRRQSNVMAVKSERTKLEELLKVPESSARGIKECEKLLVTQEALKEKEENALSELMGSLKEKAEPLMTERSKLETKLISLRDNVDRAKSDYEIAKSELELYTSVEKGEREKLANLRESLESTVAKVSERKGQLVSLDTKIPATEISLAEARNELEGVRGREAEATGRLKGMRLIYEEERCAMQASRSRNKILDSLMREKADGRIAGIFGRLGDLGAIDSKYDVAVSTACGPLDNIVVDTVNSAQACITFLRENDIGRATFIPLEKQQRFLAKCKEPIVTPENVPRLFDLIKVDDERVLTAFYYALQDTLVARDLEQATRIAYGAKRYRVVTMKGELIELSGTMSGGGRTVFKGRMGQKVVRNEPSTADVERLQAELDAVYNECNRLKTKREQLENQVETLSSALKEMKMARDKYRIEVRALEEQEPLLRKQLNVQEGKVASSASNPTKVRDMTSSVEEAQKHMEEAERQSKSVEKEVDRVNRRIDEISGNRVKEQQGKISSAAKSIEKTRGEMCRLQVAVKTAERNARKAEQRIETLENDVKSCEQKIRDVQREKNEIEVQAKDLLEKINRLTDAIAERDESLASFKAELGELQARETKMKTVKIDLEQQLNGSQRKLMDLKHRTGEYTKKISRLELRPVPGEQIDELKELNDEEIAELDEKALAASLDKAKKKLPSEIPNMRIISDYREKDALYLQRAADLEEITSQRNKVRDAYEMARQRRVQEFLDGFTLITGKLKEMYQMITLGGDAELELVDSLDPFSEGVVFSVRPPKKTWKNISSLSGGEKTLSSLALVFALHHYKPTPLYFMDEIDAALDFKNVSIVGNYIKERTKNAQFIVISLRSNMFELADYLVGIYKTYNCSKCATVHVSKFYGKSGIGPPTQSLTSKTHAYGSQSQRPFSQLARTAVTAVSATQREEPSVAQNLAPLTCPPRFERQDAAPALTTAVIASPPLSSATSPRPTSNQIELPDLGLCPTPVKVPTVTNRTSTENGEGKDKESEGWKQLRKRRKP